jgi:homoprotocatechuate degradation regulator HpaR
MKQAATQERISDPVVTAPAEAESKIRMLPFTQSLPSKLLRLREAVIQRFRPLVHMRQLTDQQWRIIRALAEFKEAEILILSEWCTIHPASLSRILPKMETAGLITRRTNAADKRRVIVSLSEKGWALYESILPDSDVVYQTLIDDIGPERLDELNRILDGAIDALTKPRGGRHS